MGLVRNERLLRLGLVVVRLVRLLLFIVGVAQPLAVGTRSTAATTATTTAANAAVSAAIQIAGCRAQHAVALSLPSLRVRRLHSVERLRGGRRVVLCVAERTPRVVASPARWGPRVGRVWGQMAVQTRGRFYLGEIPPTPREKIAVKILLILEQNF